MGRKSRGAMVGCKYPRLCNFIQEIAEAWPGMKAITVDRPLEEIVRSTEKARFFENLGREGIESLTRKWLAHRDIDIEILKIPTLRLGYHDVLADPAGAVDGIIAFLGISPTTEQRAAAIAFVDPALHRIRAAVADTGDGA